jgi:hypothetical protein
MDPSRTTSLGLVRYAFEFANAAQFVHQNAKEPAFSAPAYYLASHSVELSLKAFLLCRGLTLDDLASPKYGHKLGVLLDRSLAKGLRRLVSLSEEECAAIRLLSNHHEVHRFRYIEVGTMSVPEWVMVLVISQKLPRGLRRFCYRRCYGREPAGREI